jgi:hypothetical protein
MLVGVPREIKDNEYRVGIVPSTGRIAGAIVLRSSKPDGISGECSRSHVSSKRSIGSCAPP